MVNMYYPILKKVTGYFSGLFQSSYPFSTLTLSEYLTWQNCCEKIQFKVIWTAVRTSVFVRLSRAKLNFYI